MCFDLGRVLVRICDGWQHACRTGGIAVPGGEPDPAATARLHELVCLSDTGRLDLDGFAREAAPLLRLQPADVVALSNAYLLGIYPGVDELLADLASRRLPTACLSNTNANHWRIMNDPAHISAVPFARFTHRFASHLVGVRKPDAAIYEHVERTAGVPGRQLVFFDDMAENVEAARGRGWRAFQVAVGPDPVTQMRRRLQEMALI